MDSFLVADVIPSMTVLLALLLSCCIIPAVIARLVVSRVHHTTLRRVTMQSYRFRTTSVDDITSRTPSSDDLSGRRGAEGPSGGESGGESDPSMTSAGKVRRRPSPTTMKEMQKRLAPIRSIFSRVSLATVRWCRLKLCPHHAAHSK